MNTKYTRKSTFADGNQNMEFVLKSKSKIQERKMQKEVRTNEKWIMLQLVLKKPEENSAVHSQFAYQREHSFFHECTQ